MIMGSKIRAYCHVHRFVFLDINSSTMLQYQKYVPLNLLRDIIDSSNFSFPFIIASCP